MINKIKFINTLSILMVAVIIAAIISVSGNEETHTFAIQTTEISNQLVIPPSEQITPVEIDLCQLASDQQVSLQATTVIGAQSTVKSTGVLAPSNCSEPQLKSALNDGLKQYADIFIQAEKETGINAIFLSSVAGLESGWGTSSLAKRSNNLFGWTIGDKYATFKSKEECIMTVARMIKANYLTEGGKYFEGYEVDDINIHYNGRPAWATTTKDIMVTLEGRLQHGLNG